MNVNWTTDNIPNLTHKVIVVTGANCGIGFEEAKEFARKSARVVLACRDMDRAKNASVRIQAEIPKAKIEIMQLDLASQASVHRFTSEFRAKYNQLDVLMNNAGIMMAPYSTTEDGFESQFATNHLGHFALTGLLIDLLLKTPGSRVVNVSSSAHRFGNMDFSNLMYENGNGYTPTRAYGRSKLANLLFTYELQRHFEAAKAESIAVAAHPGSSNTNLTRYMEGRWFFKFLLPLMKLMVQSAAMGALPAIRAAVDPDAKGGEYYGPGGFMEQKGYPVIVKSNSASHDKKVARQLWQVSEILTGVHYAQLNNASMG